MEIKGFIETSFVDWDGKISSVIFLPGCNFRCPYCQNHPLILTPDSIPTIPWETVEKFLNDHKDWIDGVVITGGEPTIWSDLPALIKKFKDLGFLVKLDSNGSNPQMIKDLALKGLIDYVAMDLNAPLDDRYSVVSGVKVDLSKIKETIDFLMKGNMDYEFRTTVVPTLIDGENILEMAKAIQGAKKFVLQQFNPAHTLDPKLGVLKPYFKEEIGKMVEEVKKYVENCYMRGA